jgi:hypothetical protein
MKESKEERKRKKARKNKERKERKERKEEDKLPRMIMASEWLNSRIFQKTYCISVTKINLLVSVGIELKFFFSVITKNTRIHYLG